MNDFEEFEKAIGITEEDKRMWHTVGSLLKQWGIHQASWILAKSFTVDQRRELIACIERSINIDLTAPLRHRKG